MTADNVIDGEYSTQGWNRFSYVKNNPIIYKDPTGHNGEVKDRQAHNATMRDLSSNSAVLHSYPTDNTNKHSISKEAAQNKGLIDNSPSCPEAEIVEKLNDKFNERLDQLAQNRSHFGTIQYSTDVVIKSIEKIMAQKEAEYEKTGNKKVLTLTADEIIKDVKSTEIKPYLLGQDSGGNVLNHGSGSFRSGKTLGQEFKEMRDVDILASELNVEKLAESFINGKKDLESYYEKTSGYYGQAISENLKLLRMDDYSAITEKQFSQLLEKRDEFAARGFNKK